MATGRSRRTAWLVVFSILTLAVAGLFGAVVRQSWLTNAAAADVVERETQGAAILHPMTTVISELVKARSAAVRGATVDAPTLRNALAGVAKLDKQYGETLRTTQRLTDLTTQVDAALSHPVTGREAFQTYSGLITLAVDLELRIGDTSDLVHDPDLDSYYLMDAAIVRLPQAMVYAGSAADLVGLAGVADLRGDDAIKAAVARFGVSTAAEAVTDGLNTAVEFTSRADLGSTIAERLDGFKAAVADFAPPTMLSVVSGPIVAENLAAGANRVFAAATPLVHQLLYELQEVLEDRGARLASDWRFTATAAGSAALVGIALIWLMVMARPRGGSAPAAAAVGAPEQGPPVGSFAYARELLNSQKLVSVGEAARSRERGDAR